MTRFMFATSILLFLFVASGTYASQPDFRAIQHRFVEMGVGAERHHISSAEQWQAFWSRFANTNPPDIDFRSNDIIVVLMGTQGSGGFSIRIDDIKSKPHGTRIRLLVCRPPEGMAEVSEVTSPYDVAIISKLIAPIEWVTVESCLPAK